MSGLEKSLFQLKVRRPQSCSHTANPRSSPCQFTAKSLNRQAAKAGKEETAEKAKIKKVCPIVLAGRCVGRWSLIAAAPLADTYVQAMQQGNNDIAKLYAQNAIRKQNERLNLLRLASRIDAVASRVQTAVTMRQVSGSMANVVKGMDSAMKTMNLERVRPAPHLSSVAGRQANRERERVDFARHGQV